MDVFPGRGKPPHERRIIDEQIAYYGERAAEYDMSAPGNRDPLYPHLLEVQRAVTEFEPRGKILELACGTGNWTGRLAEHAGSVVALDASFEMLARARAKTGNARVRYVQANLFSWTPDDAYDVVFFAFWLSHVPLNHFEGFWRLVGDCLAPSGRVFFVDEGNHEQWREEWLDESSGLVRRRLADGTAHRAVKVFWDKEPLEDRLEQLGWRVSVSVAGAFYWGSGTRA